MSYYYVMETQEPIPLNVVEKTEAAKFWLKGSIATFSFPVLSLKNIDTVSIERVWDSEKKEYRQIVK